MDQDSWDINPVTRNLRLFSSEIFRFIIWGRLSTVYVDTLYCWKSDHNSSPINGTKSLNSEQSSISWHICIEIRNKTLLEMEQNSTGWHICIRIRTLKRYKYSSKNWSKLLLLEQNFWNQKTLWVHILFVQEVVTPIYIMRYYIKWVTTSWIYGIVPITL